MNCRKIQELLKTDYLDCRLNPRQKEDIKRHLEICPRCYKSGEELQAQRMFFKKIKQQEVPERVWHNIHEAIVTQEVEQESIFAPRLVFSLASAFAVVILVLSFTGISIYKHQTIIELNNEEIITNYSLTNNTSNTSYDLETSIEQYFL